MSWLRLLGFAILLAAVAAVTGMKPKGTRPVAHTQMMAVGRVILLILAAILVFLALRARSGH